MTLKEASKGVYSVYCRNYYIGFLNSDEEEDQTDFENVQSFQELNELYRDFCRENKFKTNTVLYIERA